ncbi:MAG: hypothetical protein MUC87_01280 [Bacteroidia bacterium]|jgi:hypothetical protein|nr:hypothetical protein [Bacteroidia bacterium]
MNNLISSFRFLLILLPAIVLTQCTKEGPPGPQGEPGTVNISTYLFTPTNWYVNSNSDWTAAAAIPEITADNIDNVAVMVYFKPVSAWRALPYTHVSSTNYFMGFYHYVGAVEMLWTYNGIGSGSDPNDYFNTNVQFKIIVLPADQRNANPDLDWNDYEAVKQRFNIQEEQAQAIQ